MRAAVGGGRATAPPVPRDLPALVDVAARPAPGRRGHTIALLVLSATFAAGATLVVHTALEGEHAHTVAAPEVALSAPLATGVDGATLAATHGDAVYRVESAGCGIEERGTAFAVGAHHLVTNHHVVHLDPTPDLVSRDGSRLTGQVVGWRTDPDVAVIAVDQPLPARLEWAGTDELTEGQHLLALGYPVPAFDFAATPSAIVSFERAGGTRTGIRAAGTIDRGNSGGPVVTASGEVAGVVTSVMLDEGFHVVPLLATSAALASEVEAMIAAPTSVAADCGAARPLAPAEATEAPLSDGAGRATLDLLWSLCADGDGAACDELYRRSPPGTEHERFGDTCGHRAPPGQWCAGGPERRANG